MILNDEGREELRKNAIESENNYMWDTKAIIIIIGEGEEVDEYYGLQAYVITDEMINAMDEGKVIEIPVQGDFCVVLMRDKK